MPRSLLSRFSRSITPSTAEAYALPVRGAEELIGAREMTRRLIGSARPLLVELESRPPASPIPPIP